MLAVLKAGAAYVPLDPGFPADRIGLHRRATPGVGAVLSLSHLRATCGEMRRRRSCASTTPPPELARSRRRTADRGRARRRPPTSSRTSSTRRARPGRPKGVAVEHASICNFVRVAAEVYGVRPGDRMYQGMTIAFDFSVEEIWVPWAAGATLVPKPAGSALLGRGPARLPRRAPGHGDVLRADAAGDPRGGPARPAVPAGVRRGVPARPDRALAPAGTPVPQRLRADRGHRHRDLDRRSTRTAR